jgi:signal transduction histidine kinase
MRIRLTIPPWADQLIDQLGSIEHIVRRHRALGVLVGTVSLAAVMIVVAGTAHPPSWVALFFLPVIFSAWILGIRGALLAAALSAFAAGLVIRLAPVTLIELAISLASAALVVGVAGRAVRRADKRAGVLERLVRLLGTLSPAEAPDSLCRQIVERASAIANARGGALALWDGERLSAAEWWDGDRWIVHAFSWNPSDAVDREHPVCRAWIGGHLSYALAPDPGTSLYGRSVGALAAAPFGRAEGMEQGVLVVFRERHNDFDQTDRAALRAFAVNAGVLLANARLYAEALSANARRSAFVTQVSHELGTPLHVVRGCVDSIADLELPVTAGPYIEHLQRNLVSLEELIKETIEFAELEDAEIEIVWGVVPLGALFAEIRRRFTTLLSEGVTLSTTVEPGAEFVWADTAKLRTILANLTANAVKYTTQGGVQIAARPQQGVVEISVRDTGIGIDPTVLPAIFQPFFRGEVSTTSGFGLGLTIAERLARALGTRLSVESAAPQGGSTFSFTLGTPPIRIAEESCNDAA